MPARLVNRFHEKKVGPDRRFLFKWYIMNEAIGTMAISTTSSYYVIALSFPSKTNHQPHKYTFAFTIKHPLLNIFCGGKYYKFFSAWSADTFYCNWMPCTTPRHSNYHLIQNIISLFVLQWKVMVMVTMTAIEQQKIPYRHLYHNLWLPDTKS